MVRYVQLGYLAGLQLLLFLVMFFIDFSDESGGNAVTHEPQSPLPSRISLPTTSSVAVNNGSSTLISVTNDSKQQPLLDVVQADGIGIEAGYIETIDASYTSLAVPTLIEFKNLSYSVTIPSQKRCGQATQRKLLTTINGYARPGCMTALMGPSGAGKSTLLDLLANKKTGGKIEGDILINGEPRNDKTFPRISGYVEQNDSHYPTMTVREAVLFSARLRLPSSISIQAKTKRTDSVLRDLLLTPFANDLIGDDIMAGVSPEIRKKVVCIHGFIFTLHAYLLRNSFFVCTANICIAFFSFF